MLKFKTQPTVLFCTATNIIVDVSGNNDALKGYVCGLRLVDSEPFFFSFFFSGMQCFITIIMIDSSLNIKLCWALSFRVSMLLK